MSKTSRPPITPEYLEKQGPPWICNPAEGLLAVVSGDGYETVDMTFEQAHELYEKLGRWLNG